MSWLTSLRRWLSGELPPERRLPADWWDTALAAVPLLADLNTDERRVLGEKMAVFLRDVQIMGVQGLEITDAIRVSIAAQACLLLLGLPSTGYAGLYTIVVYPDTYVVDMVRHNEDGTITVGAQARRGESWTRGHVVLSWDDVEDGAGDPDDGLNVVIHEFAHQLDALDGSTNGAPPLHRHAHYAPWARVLGETYAELRERIARREPSLLRAYGATNPAEFFAVATEVFFERPVAMKRHHPELYDELAQWFRQDPAGRVGGGRAG